MRHGRLPGTQMECLVPPYGAVPDGSAIHAGGEDTTERELPDAQPLRYRTYAQDLPAKARHLTTGGGATDREKTPKTEAGEG